MSVIVSTAEQISHCPTNSSPAKALYSFGRTERFKVRPAYNNSLCYDKKSLFKSNKVKNPDKTTFGVGSRGEIFMTNEIRAKPSPFQYKIKSTFTPRSYAFDRAIEETSRSSERSSERKKNTFGAPRSAYDKVASAIGWNYQPHDRVLPGPGYYQATVVEQKDRYSMRGRGTNKLFQILPTPGPGAYEIVAELQKNGKQMISKYERTKTPQIQKQSFTSPSKFDRVAYYKHRPGPGQYNSSASKDMHSVLSMKYSRLGKTGQISQFGRNLRRTFMDVTNDNPGPGEYVEPSEFGHYMAKSQFRESLLAKDDYFQNHSKSNSTQNQQEHSSLPSSKETQKNKPFTPVRSRKKKAELMFRMPQFKSRHLSQQVENKFYGQFRGSYAQ